MASVSVDKNPTYVIRLDENEAVALAKFIETASTDDPWAYDELDPDLTYHHSLHEALTKALDA